MTRERGCLKSILRHGKKKSKTYQKTTFGYKANKIPNLLFQNKPKCNYRKDQLQQNNTNERKINETD